ncbi:MAG: hypothetical protein N2558_05110 [Patescibacteria group bacterium]|nr:hypothetical protein [Patescibacteria group bacterium]
MPYARTTEMKTIITVIFSLSLFANGNGQIKLNPGIDTSSTEHKEVLRFWTEYIKSRPSKNSTDYLEFWNDNDKNLFKQPDLILHSINTEYSTLAMGYPTILSILPYQKDFFEIKTAIGWADNTGHVSLLAIVNHYVKKNEGNYKLFVPLNIKENINSIENDDFIIYSLANTAIPSDTLRQLSAFISNLKSDYGLADNKKLLIIYGKNSKETETILGFDFNLMSSTNNPSSGISDLSNNLIILNGLSSIFHETTHIYLNPLFPESPLLEGLATFYGGSMGKSLAEGIRFIHSYVKANTKINLYEKMKEGSFYINNEYNPTYILQGLLIQIAYDKNGIEEIKRLLAYRDLNEIFEIYFNLKGTDSIDKFLKSELKKRAIR